MNRVELSAPFLSLLKAARRVADANDAEAILLLAEQPYNFTEIKKSLRSKIRLMIASDKPEVLKAAEEDDFVRITLQDEPQTRQTQLSQALLEAIADEHLKSGDVIVGMYASFERDRIDTFSLISLTEHLAKLTSRDLRRLKTNVPLETLRICVDLAVEVGREGREGKKVGTILVVGNHTKVMELSHEGVHDPFRGYADKDCLLRTARVRESIKELALIDGAFVISSQGVAKAAGRILDAPAAGLTLSQGLGARHWAAAAISKATQAIAIAVSESTGTVRIFQEGIVVLRIEPMDHAMKWHDFETEPPEE